MSDAPFLYGCFMSSRLLTLVTNDDGIHAAGIRAVIDQLSENIDPFIVAPMRERSGAGHSITLGRDIHLKEISANEFAFDGTPVDCVSFALRNLVKEKPEFCISGINLGANLGNDTLCSGTVGAALAAAKEGIPGIAVSIVGRHGPYHIDTAIAVLKSLLHYKNEIISHIHNRILNVNVPNLPEEQLKGIKVCQLGERIWSEEFVSGKSANSFRYHHEEPINFGDDNTDVVAIENGWATVSVLVPSLFDSSTTEGLEKLILGEKGV